jgi:hypothetical protein
MGRSVLFGATVKTNAKQRSMKYLRDRGWVVADVEKWIPPRGAMKFGVRKDVWGFGDLLVCGDGIALIQCCADSGGKAGMEAHRQKMLTIDEIRNWKIAGGKVFLHGWKRRKPRGERARWILSEEEL